MSRKIIVGFSKPQNRPLPIFSWIIRAVDNTEYSHVYLKIKSESLDEMLLYEAANGYVNFRSLELWNQKNAVVAEFEVDITDEQLKILLKWCIKNSGKPYSVKQLVGIGWNYVRKAFNYPPKNIFKNEEDGMVCSEVLARILSVVYGIDTGIDFDLVDPRDIYEILSSYATKVY